MVWASLSCEGLASRSPLWEGVGPAERGRGSASVAVWRRPLCVSFGGVHRTGGIRTVAGGTGRGEEGSVYDQLSSVSGIIVAQLFSKNN